MNFDLQTIIASKRAYRRALAARDILEKLRTLDVLRERAIALRVREGDPLSTRATPERKPDDSDAETDGAAE